METLDSKLTALQEKLNNTADKIVVMIIGLGSVGTYLLDYLVSLADPRLDFVVVGRNRDKMLSDVNIVRTAATIRRQYRGHIDIDTADLNDVSRIREVIDRWKPDFIVNSSRVYSGLKYGSISWKHLRAYGIWTPLSVKFAKNIMDAYARTDSHAITINTSYSDAVIPWLKSAGMPSFDFGSGNLNHLIPRMKFYIAEKFGIDNLNDIDITLAVSHFHDVVISKEGHAEGQQILLDVRHEGKPLDVDQAELLNACQIAMPVDQKRNMMNASSNFDIINSILIALREHRAIKIHTPGVGGEIGGYPFIIDGTGEAHGYIDESIWPLDEMRAANRRSIYLDGIADVENGVLEYTPELIAQIRTSFDVAIPPKVSLEESEKVANLIIGVIIKKQI